MKIFPIIKMRRGKERSTVPATYLSGRDALRGIKHERIEANANSVQISPYTLSA